jgi:hypothetical protein
MHGMYRAVRPRWILHDPRARVSDGTRVSREVDDPERTVDMDSCPQHRRALGCVDESRRPGHALDRSFRGAAKGHLGGPRRRQPRRQELTLAETLQRDFGSLTVA